MIELDAGIRAEFVKILSTPTDTGRRILTFNLREFPQSSEERGLYSDEVLKWLPKVAKPGQVAVAKKILQALLEEAKGVSWDHQDRSLSTMPITKMVELAEDFNPFPSGSDRRQKGERLDSILNCFLVSTVYDMPIFSDDYAGLIGFSEANASLAKWDWFSAYMDDRDVFIERMIRVTIRTHIYLLLREILASLPAISLRQKRLSWNDHFIGLTEHFPFYFHAECGLRWMQYVRHQLANVRGVDRTVYQLQKKNADKLLLQVTRNLMGIPDTFRDRTHAAKGVLKSRVFLEEFVRSRGQTFSLSATDRIANTLKNLDATDKVETDVERYVSLVRTLRAEVGDDLKRFYSKKKSPTEQKNRIAFLRLLFRSIVTSPPSYVRARDLLYALTEPMGKPLRVDVHKIRKMGNTQIKIQ